MKRNPPIPTEAEKQNFLLGTVRHVFRVEYFLSALGLGASDPQRPHDLVGPGNKFELEVIWGLAMQYRQPKNIYAGYLSNSLARHRQQYHHQKWNDPDPKDINLAKPEATEDDLLGGAVDAVCSLLEQRQYQGGIHKYEQIRQIALKNPPHKQPWLLKIIPEMEKISQPQTDLISDLENLPNIGLTREVYEKIVGLTNSTLFFLNNLK